MRRQILVGTLMSLALAHPGTVLGEPTPQQAAQPIPWGQQIPAQDGDVIFLEDEARVRIVRRRQAMVRTISNASEQWLVALVDFAPRNGRADGRVDRLYIWRQTQGGWPIAERWEGGAILEEYSAPGQNPGGIGLVFPAGRVQLLSSGGTNMFADSQAIAIITHRSAASTIGNGASFDEAEQRALADIAANPRPESITTRSSGGMASVRMETGALVTTDTSATYTRVSPGPRSRRAGPRGRQHPDAAQDPRRRRRPSRGRAAGGCSGRRDSRDYRGRGRLGHRGAYTARLSAPRSGGARRRATVAVRTDAAQRDASAGSIDSAGQLPAVARRRRRVIASTGRRSPRSSRRRCSWRRRRRETQSRLRTRLMCRPCPAESLSRSSASSRAWRTSRETGWR